MYLPDLAIDQTLATTLLTCDEAGVMLREQGDADSCQQGMLLPFGLSKRLETY